MTNSKNARQTAGFDDKHFGDFGRTSRCTRPGSDRDRTIGHANAIPRSIARTGATASSGNRHAVDRGRDHADGLSRPCRRARH